MKIKKFNLFIIIIFLLNFNYLSANEKISIIDLDAVFNNSNFGIFLLKDIEKINKENISKLKKIENELKKNEEDIKNKKNIITQDEFEKQITLLKKKINDYRKLKKKMIDNIELEKKNMLKNFFNKVNPLIQNYMETNSINILLERKNVFIGKNNSDITNAIINEINNKIKY